MAQSQAAPAQPAIPPEQQALDVSLGLWRSRALAVATELGIADHLASGPLHVNELGARTKSHAPSLFRLMRALESIGLFTQVSPRVFANTRATELLRKDVPGSRWAGVMLMSARGGEIEAWLGLMGSVQTGHIAVDQTFGYNWWEFLKRNPRQAAIFDEAMRAYTEEVTPTITAALDWSRFSVIVDVGGGIGTQLVDILNAHPSCRGILFDQPDVVARAIPHERMERVGGSFFERVPAGADAYLLRQVIHDWADTESTAILKTVRGMANPESRVILIEQIIEEGSGYAMNKWMDLLMLVLVGGQERTVTEYRQLLEMAGFEAERIIPTAGPFSLVVGRPHD
jgi:hypothetical protein